MADVKVRVTAGVGAWLIGATTATCLSLFAVSYLNTDLTGTQGATLSAQDVTRALSSAATATPSAPAPASSGSGGPAPDASGPAASSTASALNGATAAPPSASPPSATGQPTTTTSAPATTSTSQAMTPAKRRISGHGGQVEAQCQGSSAYLVSWSPAQGFHAGPVQRGPARYVAVVFVDDGLQRQWPLRVSCLNGTPTAVSGDDDWHDR